jgi:hypothetical protein
MPVANARSRCAALSNIAHIEWLLRDHELKLADDGNIGEAAGSFATFSADSRMCCARH